MKVTFLNNYSRKYFYYNNYEFNVSNFTESTSKHMGNGFQSKQSVTSHYFKTLQLYNVKMAES